MTIGSGCSRELRFGPATLTPMDEAAPEARWQSGTTTGAGPLKSAFSNLMGEKQCPRKPQEFWVTGRQRHL